MLAPVQVTEMVMVQPQAAVVTAEAVIVSTSLSYLASITSIMNVSDRASYIVCTIDLPSSILLGKDTWWYILYSLSDWESWHRYISQLLYGILASQPFYALKFYRYHRFVFLLLELKKRNLSIPIAVSFWKVIIQFHPLFLNWSFKNYYCLFRCRFFLLVLPGPW